MINKNIIKTCIEKSHNAIILRPPDKRFWHYAFIIQNNKIITFGQNNKVNFPTIYRINIKNNNLFYYYVHAEYSAYRKAVKLKHIFNKHHDFSILVIRLNKQLQLRMSKPCTICHNFLKNTNCKKIFFSNEKEQIDYYSL